jgi:DnaK suppressor protein
MAAKAGSKTAPTASAEKTPAEKVDKKKKAATEDLSTDTKKTSKAAGSSPNKKKSETSSDAEITAYQPEANEEYMNPKQLDHFRSMLNKWKQELMEEVDRTVHHMKDENASLPDPADRASQEEEFNFELRARDRERKLIKKIEQSIESIEHGDYGYCEACGVEIGLRRLEARPTANLCIDCKTLDEIKEKQTKG